MVLRAYLPGREWLSPERARCEFRTIELAQKAGIPAPEPLFLDADGEFLGHPAMILSYLPGKPLYVPSNVSVWAEDLARAMLAIHAVTPQQYGLSWLPRFGRDELAGRLDVLREKVEAHEEDLAREVLAALEANLDRIEWVAPCLVHDDFWPGNTVWYRGRLTGVIDWADALLGDPRVDLPQCCIDAYLANDLETANAVRDAYLRLTPYPVPDQWYFDLLIGLRALLYYEHWLIAYHEVGLTRVTRERSRERIHHFLRRALIAAS